MWVSISPQVTLRRVMIVAMTTLSHIAAAAAVVVVVVIVIADALLFVRKRVVFLRASCEHVLV